MPAQIQFILTNFSFTVNIFASLVFFSIAWLHFDAWLSKKSFISSFTFVGFLLFSLSFLGQATYLDNSFFSDTAASSHLTNQIAQIVRALAYLFIIADQTLTRLQPRPEHAKKQSRAGAFTLLPVATLGLFILPILSAFSGILYLRRATIGIEAHLRKISYSFFLLSLYEITNLHVIFQDSQLPMLRELTSTFGPIWFIGKLIFIVCIMFLVSWSWSYLLKRFDAQLFMIFTATTITIFVISTIIFTNISINSQITQTLDNLETNVKLFEYTIDNSKKSLISEAVAISKNTKITTSLSERNRQALVLELNSAYLSKDYSDIVITDANGGVLGHGQDSSLFGESVSSDPVFKRTLTDKTISAITTTPGILSPKVTIKAASIITDSSNQTIGTVIITQSLDDSYLDGIKSATGLDASVYVGAIKSATTITASDGKSRWVGTEDKNIQVTEKVLGKSEIYSGSVNLLNLPYFASYSPIKDIDNNPIGMFFVGKPQYIILQSTSDTLRLTFATAAILCILSTIPSFFISTYITKQIR